MKAKNNIEVSAVKVGSIVKAHHYQTGKWRSAKIISITPANTHVGLGYYVQWLDIDCKDFSKSQTAWVNSASVQLNES